MYIMKNWMKFAAVLLFSAFVFTSCQEDEVILSVPGDATIDLGTDFDPMAEVSVDGADIEDVVWTAVPAWNANEVNHYVFTYAVADQSVDRNVYVQVDELLGTYQVIDQDDDGTTYSPYPVIVTKGAEYNSLRFNELWYAGVIVNGEVNGSVITIPSQTVNAVDGTATVSGTGTYDGATGEILTINYNITDAAETYVGVSTFD